MLQNVLRRKKNEKVLTLDILKGVLFFQEYFSFSIIYLFSSWMLPACFFYLFFLHIWFWNIVFNIYKVMLFIFKIIISHKKIKWSSQNHVYLGISLWKKKITVITIIMRLYFDTHVAFHMHTLGTKIFTSICFRWLVKFYTSYKYSEKELMYMKDLNFAYTRDV